MRSIAAAIARIARAEGVGGLVVGLPLEMDGTFGAAAQAARDWAHALSDATGLPTSLWDERLSTAAVTRFLIGEADFTRKQRADLVDQMAAAYMLQAALDAGDPPAILFTARHAQTPSRMGERKGGRGLRGLALPAGAVDRDGRLRR